ncbi:MAG: ABC transporter ATP-binding protein [Jatrophihabitans sp.]
MSFAVRPTEIVAVMGRSGSGKSTLLACLGLLTTYDRGVVSIANVDSSRLTDRRRARLRNTHIGFVFQSYSLVAHLSAAENVELPLLYGRRMSRAKRKERVCSALEMVGLSDRADSRPKHLSGGEQQRVAVARGLIKEPKIVLADEPTGALDVDTGSIVWDLLADTARKSGAALLVVTHDEIVAQRADRVLSLQTGVLTTVAL